MWEYRQANGFDGRMFRGYDVDGALFYIKKEAGRSNGYLIDPTGRDSQGQSALKEGESFTDFPSGVRITVISRSPDSLRLGVDWVEGAVE